MFFEGDGDPYSFERDDFPEEFVRRLKKAKRVVVLTGPRLSAETGLPTFRDNDGMYKHYRPEDLTNLQAFRDDPRLVWEWHDWRRQLIAAAKPSVAHKCLARMEGLFEDFFLITQTLDDIHRVAGNKNILELDGNIWTTKCMKCGAVHENREVPLKTNPPICVDCGSIERPNVIWFGDLIDDAILDIAWERAGKADVLLAFGTGGGLQPIIGISGAAQGKGAYVFNINIDKTPLTFTAHFAMEKNCGVVLTEMLKLIESFRR